MGSLFGFLNGYKAYIVSALVAAIGLVDGGLGFDIPGVDVGDNWLGWILTGMGLGAGRSAIKKLES